ncbi:hypothetical protein BJV74DRAFT_830162 [Russula compacta]|nr:hypothetical protein BJV74DRAFT_830162 [Russula compacta]
MSSMTSVPECPICLDKFRNPVVTPCGHLTCEPCIKHHARVSPHPHEAKCPTCRAPFPTVMADLSVIPREYHMYISSPLRRVYLGDGEDGGGRAVDVLKLQIATLNADLAKLRRDNGCLMVRLLCAERITAYFLSDEFAAGLHVNVAQEETRLALDKAKEEARLADKRLEKLKSEYDALKSQAIGSPPVVNTKRRRGQAALDTPASNITESLSQRTSHSFNFNFKGRPIKPLPKRARQRSRVNQTDPSSLSVSAPSEPNA